MDIVNKVLANVPKDADGFDDLDAFWQYTDKLAFPLSERILSAVLRSVKVSKPSGTPVADEDTDTDFDYDTSSEIDFDLTLDSKADDKEEDDDDASTEPENEGNLPRSMAEESTPIPTPVPTPTPASVPSTGKAKTRLSSATLTSPNMSAADFNDMSFQTQSTARGRKSSLLSDDSEASTIKATPRKAATTPTVTATPSTFNKTSLTSASSKNRTTTTSLASPDLSAPSAEVEEEPLGEESTNPTPRQSAARRVSFGGQINLSPIEGGDGDVGGGGFDDWMDAGDDMQLLEDDEEGASRGSSLGRGRRASSSSSRRTSVGASSAAGTTPSTSFTTPKLNKKTAGDHQYITPKSAISTPGSNDFRRGRRLSDSTFLGDGSEEEDDDLGGSDSDKMSGDEGSGDAKKAKGAKGKGKAGGKVSEVEGETDVSTSFVDSSYLNTISSANKKYVEGRGQIQALKKKRRFEVTDDDEELHTEDEHSDEGEGVRRSRRATKGQRFAFWKGERPVYQEGTVVGLITAEPTPKKTKPGNRRGLKKGGKEVGARNKNKAGSSRLEEDESEDAFNYSEIDRFVQQVAPPPPVRLPPKVTYMDPVKQPSFSVWDDYAEHPVKQKVVSVRAAMPPLRTLPAMEARPAGKEKTGSASHTFVVSEIEREMSGWIAGYLDLPPQAIKDAEYVGKYAQVFYIAKGQDKALEFALADPSDEDWSDKKAQRVVLSPGDSFYVPAGNTYRLENHSASVTCEMFFVVVQPISEPEDVAGSSVSNNTVAQQSK